MRRITIIGRPNVGKSTLFNRLTRRWQSIVEDRPGITRDALEGRCNIEGHEFQLVDTGGLTLSPRSKLERKVSGFALKSVEQADLILFVVDGRAGLLPEDDEWARHLRSLTKPKILIVNKLDTEKLEGLSHDFYRLGWEPLIPMSFEKERNFHLLNEHLLHLLDLQPLQVPHKPSATIESSAFSIALIGRPNVGKSSLLNAILNQERCLVDDEPGTTRDPIHTDVCVDGQNYRFIDTAGIRKRARTTSRVEKFSVVATLKMMDQADLSLLVMDSTQGPTEQDAHVAGYAFESDKPIILIATKWDEGQKLFSHAQFESLMERKINYLHHCPLLYVSAKTGKNVKRIFPVIEDIKREYNFQVKTSDLNRLFKRITEHHPLPQYKGQSIKMFYATQLASRPPTFAVFCNYPTKVHFSYKRYLMNALREGLGLNHTPMRLLLRSR